MSRRAWLVAALAVFCLMVLLALLAHFGKPLVRERLIAFLHRQFASDVALSSLDVSVFPSLRVTARGIVLRHRGRTDIAPLIQIEEITAHTSLLQLWKDPIHLSSVTLRGLKVHVPPRHKGAEEKVPSEPSQPPDRLPLEIDRIQTDDAELEILRAEPEKHPQIFLIRHLEMLAVTTGKASQFRATLTNPVPKGEIDAQGQFGPWQAEEPGATALSAAYTFANADLSTIHGLSGKLSSKGQFYGVLDYLEVRGETDTPDFRVGVSRHSVPLHTDFQAIVDGTNGNTLLKTVAARFLHTALIAHGQVVKSKEMKRRLIQLDVTSEAARVEDLLRVAVPSEQPLMTGQANFVARLELPPDEEGDIITRLKLTGKFGVRSGKFSNPGVQAKVDSLSRKGQGQPNNTELASAVSGLRGNFVLNQGVMTFTDLQFDVPGAAVQLAGTYDLTGGQLDFHGIVRLQAKLSQTTTGIKSFFLKAADPFFKGKNAGAVLPIKITGTRENPSFGLELGRHGQTTPK